MLGVEICGGEGDTTEPRRRADKMGTWGLGGLGSLGEEERAIATRRKRRLQWGK